MQFIKKNKYFHDNEDIELESKNNKTLISNEKKQSFSKKIKKILSFGLVVSVVLLFTTSYSFAIFDIDWDKGINYIVWDVFVYTVSYVLVISGNVFDNFLAISLHTGFYNQDFIKIIWTELRDFANIVFILGMVYIAISIMLQDVFNVRKNLIKLIIIALLINFSFFFTRIVIDAGNVSALAFYNAMEMEVTTPDTWYTFNIIKDNPLLNNKTISGGFMSATGFKGDKGPFSADWFKALNNLSVSIMAGLIYGFIFWQFAKSFFYAAFGFLTRTILLIFYMIASPFAFVSYFLPKGLDKYFSQWLKGLFMRAFGITAYLAILYIAYRFIQADLLQTTSAIDHKPEGSGDGLSPQDILFPIIFNSIIVWKLLDIANDVSVQMNEAGKSTLGKIAGAAIGGAAMFVGGAALGAAKWAGKTGAKKVVGGGARRLLYNDNMFSKHLKEKSKNGSWATRQLANLTLVSADKLNKSKFGTGSSYHDDSTKARERDVRMKGLRGDEKDPAKKLKQTERDRNRVYRYKDENGNDKVDFANTKKGNDAKEEYNKMKTNGRTILEEKARENEKKIVEELNKIEQNQDLDQEQKRAAQEKKKKEMREEFKKKNYFSSDDISSIDDKVIDTNLDAIVGRNIDDVKFKEQHGILGTLARGVSVNYAAQTEQKNKEDEKDIIERERKFKKEQERHKSAGEIRQIEESVKQELDDTARKDKDSVKKALYEGENTYTINGKEHELTDELKAQVAEYKKLNADKKSQERTMDSYVDKFRNGKIDDAYINGLGVSRNDAKTLKFNKKIIDNKRKLQADFTALQGLSDEASLKKREGLMSELTAIKEMEKESEAIIQNHFKKTISDIEGDIKAVKSTLDTEYAKEVREITNTLKQKKAAIKAAADLKIDKLKVEGEMAEGEASVRADMRAKGDDIEHRSQVGYATAAPEANT